MADEHGHLAFRQEGVRTVAFGEGDAIPRQVRGGHHAVGLELIPQHRQVEALVQVVGAGGLDQQCMALPLRPAGHVPGADVTGEHLAATDLADPIDPPTGLATSGVPGLGATGDLFFEQRGEGLAAERREGDADAGDNAALQEGAAG
ncbi:hypothetical protein D9M68_576260 [compost metagenome]